MYSIYIPLNSNPTHAEIKTEIDAVFEDFYLNKPKILENNYGDIEVSGKYDEFCIFSSMFFEPPLREYPECEWMGDVQTRDSWLFAGIVAYAIARKFGRIILNDSGAKIGSPRIYSVNEFHHILEERFKQSNCGK